MKSAVRIGTRFHLSRVTQSKPLGVSDTQRSVRLTVVTNLEECMTVK